MRTTSLFLLALLTVPSLFADVIHLTSGGKIEGEILARTDEGVEVQLAHGRTVIPHYRIARIEKAPPPANAYRERAAALEPSDASGHFDLAVWCRDHGLSKEAQDEFSQVIEFEPDHADARRLLGHRQVGNRWMTSEEYRDHMVATGHVWHEGRWVDAAELQATRAAEDQAKARRELQAQVNRLVRLMGSANPVVAARAHADLLAFGVQHGIPGMPEAASQVKRYYDRLRVTTEVHASNAGPTTFRQVATTLGGGTSPVTIELPSSQLQSVHTTVQVPAGGR